MIRLTTTALLAILGIAVCAPLAAHDNPPVYDRINLSASASRDVETDMLVAVLFKQHQSSDQATASNVVNKAVKWAVEKAKSTSVKVTTSSYQTQPIYEKRQIQGWRVFQSIRIESAEAKQMADLLGTLQEQLAIQSLQNELSKQARMAAEENLIADALNAFQTRAAAIAKTLGRSGHRIVNINISAGGGRPQRTMMRSNAMAMESANRVAAPATESGSLSVEVQVNGTIELIAP